ncbi:MAG TPA: tetratricopeptide repeat protein [Vicinamibacteria bacterium]
MGALRDALTRLMQAVSRRAAPGLLAGLALLASVSAAGQSLPPLPKLPLDTYEPGIREPITEADEAVRRAPRDPERNGALGMLLYANEQYELAEICLARAHALAPAEARWAYALGRTRVYLARYDGAIASLEEALRRDPGSLPARLMLAKALLEAGRVEESRALYQRVVDEHPDTAEAHYGLGRIAAARGDAKAAIDHLRKACALFPGFGAAHYALARAYRDSGDPAKAREELALYQQDKLGWPTVPDPWLAAVVALKTGANALLRKGIQLTEEGRLREAAEEHEKALATDPKLVQAHVNLIRLYAELGEPGRAEEHYRQALAVDPNLAELHHNFGVLLIGQGRNAEAMEAFRKAVELNPAYADAQNNLAYLLMTSGKLGEAAEHYRMALESRPQYRAARFNLARILVQQGDLREAIEHLEQTLLPEDAETPRCTYALGAAWARLGNREEAVRYMREARWKATTLGQVELLASIDRDLRALGQAP